MFLDKVTNIGNTVFIIEKNMDVIKLADNIIDIGIEVGKGDVEILVKGTSKKVIQLSF